MKKIKTPIDDLIVLEPNVFGDERGYFMESYNKEVFKTCGIDVDFVQDNESKSKKGVLRGLHFQTKNPQGKLVRCSKGVIYDVAVDLRPESKTFGKWYGIELSAENKKMMYIPPKFAHGFVVLSEDAVFNYKCTELYHPESDSGIMYNSEEINVVWPKVDGDLIISEKDLKHTLSIKNICWE